MAATRTTPPRLDDLPTTVWTAHLLPSLRFWEIWPALAANKSLAALRPSVSLVDLNKAVALKGFDACKIVAVATAPRNIEALVVFGAVLAEGGFGAEGGYGSTTPRPSPALAARALHLALAYETFPTDAFPCHIFSDATAACDYARFRLALLYRDGLGVARSCATARGHLEIAIGRARPQGEPLLLALYHDVDTIQQSMRALGELVRYSEDTTPADARRAIQLIERAAIAEARNPGELHHDAIDHSHYALGLCHAALAVAGEDDEDHAHLAVLSLYRACRNYARLEYNGETDGEAAYELGRFFEEGIGVPKSRDGALLLWNVAKASPENVLRSRGRSASAHLANNDTWNSASSQSRSRAQTQFKVICDSAVGLDSWDNFCDTPPSVLAFDGYTGGAGSLLFHIYADFRYEDGVELDGWPQQS